ncbi:hypothetical protein ACOSQ3_029253 [Xanthoceras sorbifolium]
MKEAESVVFLGVDDSITNETSLLGKDCVIGVQLTHLVPEIPIFVKVDVIGDHRGVNLCEFMTSGKMVEVIEERAGIGNIADKMISEGMSSDCSISVLHKVGENSDVTVWRRDKVLAIRL